MVYFAIKMYLYMDSDMEVVTNSMDSEASSNSSVLYCHFTG